MTTVYWIRHAQVGTAGQTPENLRRRPHKML